MSGQGQGSGVPDTLPCGSPESSRTAHQRQYAGWLSTARVSECSRRGTRARRSNFSRSSISSDYTPRRRERKHTS